MQERRWDALGTSMRIIVWDDLPEARFDELARSCIEYTWQFDLLYSRFREDSLVSVLSKRTGEADVPSDLVTMLRIYAALGEATGGKINPAIGFALADSGYDAAYSLAPKPIVRATPAFSDAVTILSDTRIALTAPVLLDVGALGKGYLVDRLYDLMRESGIQRFLVDGSGDVRLCPGNSGAIRCGLEHPTQEGYAIGVFSLADGALCASATNRRAWANRNHYIDPHTGESPRTVIATWAWAPSAALADGFSSALFFADPDALAFRFPECEWLVVDANLTAKRSAGFAAELFSEPLSR